MLSSTVKTSYRTGILSAASSYSSCNVYCSPWEAFKLTLIDWPPVCKYVQHVGFTQSMCTPMFLYSHNQNANYCTLPFFLLLKTPHLLSASSQRHRNNNAKLESGTFPHQPIFSSCYLKASRTPKVCAREQVGSPRCVKGGMTGKRNTRSWRVQLHFTAHHAVSHSFSLQALQTTCIPG